MKNKPTDFGAAIKQLRLDAGLGVQELADLAGVSRITVWRAENSAMTVQIRYLRKIADALNATLTIEVTEDE